MGRGMEEGEERLARGVRAAKKKDDHHKRGLISTALGRESVWQWWQWQWQAGVLVAAEGLLGKVPTRPPAATCASDTSASQLSTNVALQNPRSQRPLAAGREGDVIWDYPQQRGAESAIIGLYSPRWAACTPPCTAHEDRPATNMGHITATDSLKKDQKAK
ncbi:uncharacterized protein CIMG_11333 [Coccidioides immitis RS]|uniref:Uncharacterized protein n=1 Tax=Coccidioides immitis (strain RS) TaxID=246410 RepID=A0A0D8JUM2_COCIM|nr:uncharacterized protein CIMG_11333 [Coccidioides immitis RS]KJF60992.1 hypothetical protein CIMG_11333 [Coccidioides immitis RS]